MTHACTACPTFAQKLGAAAQHSKHCTVSVQMPQGPARKMCCCCMPTSGGSTSGSLVSPWPNSCKSRMPPLFMQPSKRPGPSLIRSSLCAYAFFMPQIVVKRFSCKGRLLQIVNCVMQIVVMRFSCKGLQLCAFHARKWNKVGCRCIGRLVTHGVQGDLCSNIAILS